jgi:phosphotransacetylase
MPQPTAGAVVTTAAVQGKEPRVLKAASEVTLRGLAKITLLGDPVAVTAEAKKLNADISNCRVVDPKVLEYTVQVIDVSCCRQVHGSVASVPGPCILPVLCCLP